MTPTNKFDYTFSLKGSVAKITEIKSNVVHNCIVYDVNSLHDKNVTVHIYNIDKNYHGYFIIYDYELGHIEDLISSGKLNKFVNITETEREKETSFCNIKIIDM